MIETPPPTALIVHAHPEPSSFSTAQAHRARQTLEADGWAVEFVELSVPAILKGWLDRVFVMGGVAGGDAGLFETARLAGRRAVVLTTTGGPAEAFTADGAFGDIDRFLFHIHRGMLEFAGYEVLEPVITYGPAHLDDAERAAGLLAVEAAFRLPALEVTR
jgi:NAD(P)H dehydrogenase (quinone)